MELREGSPIVGPRRGRGHALPKGEAVLKQVSQGKARAEMLCMVGRLTEDGHCVAEGPADGLCSGPLPARACQVSWSTTMIANSHHFVFWESNNLITKP
jgi:hypothetical protein